MKHARDDYNRIQDPLGLIGEDEPVFLFRAQDRLFVPILRAYQELLLGGDVPPSPGMMESIHQHIERAITWNEEHPPKNPDLSTLVHCPRCGNSSGNSFTKQGTVCNCNKCNLSWEMKK